MMSNTHQQISPLLQLRDLGQSYWLDNLSREMLESGALARRIEKEGLLGVTSNPATFCKAISKSDDYDADIWRLFSDGLDGEQVFTELMVRDVRRACQLFAEVYDSSGGEDGYVSIEVDPRLARHAEMTLDVARDLAQRVDQPNCLIKIPGTLEALPAIEQALAEGIKVNITLLFSMERYHAVASAYQRAMQRRVDAGESIDQMHSVASFFLSRIDVLADELLSHRLQPRDGKANAALKEMFGMTALYEARRAYAAFEELFQDPEWLRLEQNNGAQVQRVLWASTGTKNPAYSSTLYVDHLIADRTVNTMPESTIEAFANEGTPRAESIRQLALDQANRHREQLIKLGIDPGYLAQRLEDEGIQKFVEPFESAVEAIRETDNEPE